MVTVIVAFCTCFADAAETGLTLNLTSNVIYFNKYRKIREKSSGFRLKKMLDRDW
jgi:hypothetical protein